MQQQPQQPTIASSHAVYQQSSDLFRSHPDLGVFFDPSEWHHDDLVYTAGHIIGWGL